MFRSSQDPSDFLSLCIVVTSNDRIVYFKCKKWPCVIRSVSGVKSVLTHCAYVIVVSYEGVTFVRQVKVGCVMKHTCTVYEG